MLNVIDEFTRECVAVRMNRKLKSVDVIDVLSDLFILREFERYASTAVTFVRLSTIQFTFKRLTRPSVSS
jgi:hypothetical protein